jgi:hypothetical protein
LQSEAFSNGIIDAAADDGRRGSNVYKVRQWLWMFGHGKECPDGLSVEKTGAMQMAATAK